MADGEATAPPRRRDRLKARARRVTTLPLSLRTADLKVRAMSALVMLAVAGTALWAGGTWLDLFVAAVALACFAEFVRLVWRAARSAAWRAAGIAFGALYVGMGAIALIELPVAVVLGVLAVVIATDSGAYFSGRAIGGPKIAPAISPSKTWAGLGGGMLAAGLVSFGFFFSNVGERAFSVMGLGAFATGAGLAVLAQIGDFFESWLKRRAKMKDSSQLIPGHGGVFDRVDGLIPVSIAAFLLWFLVHP